MIEVLLAAAICINLQLETMRRESCRPVWHAFRCNKCQTPVNLNHFLKSKFRWLQAGLVAVDTCTRSTLFLLIDTLAHIRIPYKRISNWLREGHCCLIIMIEHLAFDGSFINSSRLNNCILAMYVEYVKMGP